MASKFRVIGLNKDGGDCECCGKKNLRKLVIVRRVEDDGDGEMLQIGSGCAAKLCRTTAASAASIETNARNVTLYPKFCGGMILE
jgi:hypothetical protein